MVRVPVGISWFGSGLAAAGAVVLFAAINVGHATAAEPGATPAQVNEDAPARPVLNPVLRQNEDWSILAGQNTSATGDLFDPLKYIRLSDDGAVWLSLGGQARMRFENIDNQGFVFNNDDGYLLWRLRMHGDLHVGEHLRVFVEGKSALPMSTNLPGFPRTLDADSIDLQQGFVDLILPLADDARLTLRGGRQMLLLGKQRLVSPLDWSNTMRSWDGVSAELVAGDLKVTGFWTQFDPVQKYNFNDPDAQTKFYGLYATGKCPGYDIGVDLYWLGLRIDDNVTVNGTTGPEDRHTVGGRLFGKCGDSDLDYDLEGAYQFGEVGNGDVSAFFIASQFGYTFSQFDAGPRLWLGLDYASGDKSPGGDVQTFNQLFPLGHAYNGYIDVVGRQNVIDLNPGVSLNLCKRLALSLQGHLFWRADKDDALYHAGGGVLRAGSMSDERFVGSELDVVLRHTLSPHLRTTLGYSHFFTGDFVREATPQADGDIDYVYLEVQFTF